jgi:hypothetical protein
VVSIIIEHGYKKKSPFIINDNVGIGVVIGWLLGSLVKTRDTFNVGEEVYRI